MMMATNKAEATTEKTTTAKTPAAGKKAVKPVAKVKPVVKRVTKKPVDAANKSATTKVKIKTVRDFSMPQVEYQKIAEIKEVCLKAGLRIKKNEVLRAGLKVLGEMDEKQIIRAIEGLAKTKAAPQ